MSLLSWWSGRKKKQEPTIEEMTSTELREIVSNDGEKTEQAKVELAKRAKGYTFTEESR